MFSPDLSLARGGQSAIPQLAQLCILFFEALCTLRSALALNCAEHRKTKRLHALYCAAHQRLNKSITLYEVLFSNKKNSGKQQKQKPKYRRLLKIVTSRNYCRSSLLF